MYIIFTIFSLFIYLFILYSISRLKSSILRLISDKLWSTLWANTCCWSSTRVSPRILSTKSPSITHLTGERRNGTRHANVEKIKRGRLMNFGVRVDWSGLEAFPIVWWKQPNFRRNGKSSRSLHSPSHTKWLPVHFPQPAILSITVTTSRYGIQPDRSISPGLRAKFTGIDRPRNQLRNDLVPGIHSQQPEVDQWKEKVSKSIHIQPGYHNQVNNQLQFHVVADHQQ